ncbi:MAG: flagellar motor switch protein FliM [Candidatus Wallbacteria bacterium]|nr:flagellar motor switch protein FliM [Candidatus Wallbacteria bacterium]
MPDTLSQDEIDALLNAISSGETPAAGSSAGAEKKDEDSKKSQRKIKIYDFKRPDKFSKEQIRTVSRIHETFARLVSNFFSTQLRSIVNVDIVSVDQITYEEFIRSIGNPTMLTVFNLGTLEGNGVFEVNLSIVFAILDRLFGGVGKTLDKVRILTEIEEAVMRRTLVKIFDLLKESWFQVIEIAPKLELIESNPQFTQIVAPSEMVLLVTFQIKIGEVEGIMNLCLPYLVLEPIVSKLTTQSWFTPMKNEASSEDIITIEKKVKNVTIPLKAVLGETKVSVRDVLNLQNGDLVILDRKSDDPINIKIGQRVKFTARPGMLGKFKAVIIEEIYRNDDEEVLRI